MLCVLRVIRDARTATSAVLLLISLAGTSSAATLLRCELAPDGSVDPPGDRIDLSVFLLPNEKEVTVELRPFLVLGEHNSRVEQVKARGQKNRDPNGLYLETIKLVRDDKSPAVDRQLIVAYADLDVPRGVHQLAYQVTVLHAGKVAVVEATPLSRVTISDQARDRMLVRSSAGGFVEQKRHVEAIVLGERTRGAGAGHEGVDGCGDEGRGGSESPARRGEHPRRLCSRRGAFADDGQAGHGRQSARRRFARESTVVSGLGRRVAQ